MLTNEHHVQHHRIARYANRTERLFIAVFIVLGARSLAHIGGFGLLMLPWSIKILWAPWVDRVGNSQRGHYRSWIIPMQLFSVVVLVVLSFLPIHALDQPHYLLLFFMTLLSLNFVGATQVDWRFAF